ncbi:MAG: hypothetical protein ACSHYB_16950 [Roseibacillus sp.]
MILALERERRDLWNQLRKAPLEELKEPYQKGWERFFVLSEQAKRRKDAEKLELALSLIRNYQRCSVNPFRHYRYKSKRMVPWEHNLSGLRARAFLSQRTSEEVMQYFRVRLREPLTRERVRELVRSGWQGKFWFRYPEYAVSQVQPFMITHCRVALPEVESRLSEVEATLRKDGNEYRLRHLKDWGFSCWRRMDERAQEMKEVPLIRREIEEAIFDFESKQEPSYWCPVLFLN